jgi:hypothetical protein
MTFNRAGHKTESPGFQRSSGRKIQTRNRAVHVRDVFTETRKCSDWILALIAKFVFCIYFIPFLQRILYLFINPLYFISGPLIAPGVNLCGLGDQFIVPLKYA